MPTAPEDRHFPVYPRGAVRDLILDSFRRGLVKQINPNTGVLFTELEVGIATAELTRWFNEADGHDLVAMTAQARALWLVDQLDPELASTGWLERYHGPLWTPAGRLPATGGSGLLAARATAGTNFVGSTTVNDPLAHKLTDPAALRYQVLFDETATVGGLLSVGIADPGALLTIRGIDSGTATNVPVGTEFVWSFGPLGTNGVPIATADFSGGMARETDRDWGKRIKRRIRHKQAAGNNAHFRAWATDASNAVADAFIYACAMHAGSVLVVPIQKRGSTKGPSGQLPAAGTLSSVIAYVTPPGSPAVPTPPNVLVAPSVHVPCDMCMRLALPLGLSSGFGDLQPWPGTDALGGVTTITALATQTSFTITRPAGSPGLPSGVTAPRLMVWNDATSRFEALQVLSVVIVGAGPSYTVTLSSAPTKTLAIGDYISPDTSRRSVVDATIEAYFDGLGPGEVVDLSTDLRAHRARRFPVTSEEYPSRAGSSVMNYLADALGSALTDHVLDLATPSVPPVPSNPTAGPNRLVAGRVGVYPL